MLKGLFRPMQTSQKTLPSKILYTLHNRQSFYFILFYFIDIFRLMKAPLDESGLPFIHFIEPFMYVCHKKPICTSLEVSTEHRKNLLFNRNRNNCLHHHKK